MEVDGQEIRDGSVFFIAEAGVNHNGDLDRARDLIDAAAEAGADAVKFQTFTTDRLVAEGAPKADYQAEQIGNEQTDDQQPDGQQTNDQQTDDQQTNDQQTDDQQPDGETSQRDMLEQYELSAADHRHLLDHCDDAGITFLSTPFDAESVALLNDLGVTAIKVGSGELTNHPLLRHIARLGRPMIVSTGMATLAEVEAAYDAIREANPEVEVSLLHCVSSYPADLSDVNLRAMERMDEQFSVPVGYSDHTTAVETPGVAVGAGATIVEKHFTLDRSLPGPDHEASLEPDELARSVELAREAAAARGTPEKRPVDAEMENRTVARKSLHAVRPIEAGETITEEAVEILRPATGLSPATLDSVLGVEAETDLEPHDPITEDAVEGRVEDVVEGNVPEESR
jgi:N-acetylneuraminate synthase/N,N'-diacetyllegionaminate synthase